MSAGAGWDALLSRLVDERPDDVAVRYLDAANECTTTLTRRELYAGAVASASALTERGARGERVLLFARSRRGFLEWFLGCLLAGATAVPCPPPRGRDRAEKVRVIVDDARAAFAVGGPHDRSAVPDDVTWFDELEHVIQGATALPAQGPGADPAVLQYTSGSTRVPRGVALSADSLIANVADIVTGFALTQHDSLLVWLPPFHDMGLIGGLLMPVLHGVPVTVMLPGSFAQDPLGWLRSVSRWGVTVSGGPTTAFESVARALEAAPAADVGDLGTWRLAFVGAEPVVASSLERFELAAASRGFRGKVHPCFGMAEATLLVSCASGVTTARAADGSTAVRCGRPVAGTDVLVVADGVPCGPGEIGEIWVAGPGVASGYWRAPDVSAESFGWRLDSDPRTYLRTGDLGFLDMDGSLVPTGRIKDVLIVGGRNVVAADLELVAVRAVEPYGAGLAAAFSLDRDDRIAVLVEVTDPSKHEELLVGMALAVAAEAGTVPAVVGLVRPGRLDRTTSGKVRRGAVRERFTAGALPAVVLDEAQLTRGATGASAARRRATAVPQERAALVHAHIDALLGRLGVDGTGGSGPLRDQVGSLDQLVVIAELELLAGAVPPRDRVLHARTVDDLVAVVLDGWRSDSDDDEVAAAPEGRHTAGAGEAAMYLWETLVPGSTTLAAAADVSGGWSPTALRAATTAVLERHEALRTTYRSGGDGVERSVRAAAEVEPWFVDEDGRDLSANAVTAWVERVAAVQFDLGRAPLLRVACLTTGDDSGVVVVTVPHAAADFRSLTLLVDDLSRAVAGVELDLAPTGYAEHLKTTQKYLTSQDAGGVVARLRNRAASGSPRLALPGRRSDQVGPHGGEAIEVTSRFGVGTTTAIEEHARSRGTTPFVLLLAAYRATLHRLTGQAHVVVATPLAGRRGRFLDTVGLFMNHVPLTSDVHAGTTFDDIVVSTAADVDRAYDEQWVPLASWWDGAAHDTPFETLFVLHQTPSGTPSSLATFELRDGAELAVGGSTWSSRRVPHRVDSVPLTVMAGSDGTGTSLVFRALRSVLGTADLEAVARAFTRCVMDLLDAPHAQILGAAALLPARPGVPQEADFAARAPRGDGPDVVDMVRRQVAVRPDAEAACDEERSLTYGELWTETGLVAAGLRQLGVRLGDVVALSVPRSVDAVVATYGVLRAGATCLHLDRSSPPARLEQMCAIADPVMLVTGTEGDRTVSDVPRAVAVRQLRTLGADAPVPDPGPSDLAAYVSFTSGSSGVPKGVVVSRRAVGAAVRSFGDALAMGPGDRVCCVSPLGWDIVVGDFYAAVARGAALVLASETVAQDAVALRTLLDVQDVTVLTAAPARWALLVDAGWRAASGFRAGAGGDVLTPRLADAVAAAGAHLWNFYGPTETVLFATAGDLAARDTGGPVTLGRAMHGYEVDMVDSNGDREDAVGEIVVAGHAMADGYLGDPRSTAEHFRPYPSGPPGSREYRTGDVARRRDDGDLEFVGRADLQVKVRGYRVEPGEVEHSLRGFAGVADALVGGVDRGAGKELAALVVTEPGASCGPADLVAMLAALLPAHMVPTRLRIVPELPMNANGKVDRQALVGIERVGSVGPDLHDDSEDTLVVKVASHMAAVLDVQHVGSRDDFFRLGGHSILALRLTARLAEDLGVQVSVRSVFEEPTPEGLAAVVRAVGPTASPAARVAGPTPLTAGQRGVWLQATLDRTAPASWIPYLVEIEGAPDEDRLTDAFDALVQHHESLRTVVQVTTAGAPYQTYGEPPRLAVVEHRNADRGVLLSAARSQLWAWLGEPVDLERGPLVRAVAHRDGAVAVLGMVVHHSVSDGWSAGVLLEDLLSLLSAAVTGAVPPGRKGPGAHEVARQRASADTSAAAAAAARDLVDPPEPLLPPPTAPGTGARRAEVELGTAPYELARDWSRTVYDVTVAAFLRAVGRLTDRTDLLVGTDVAGRSAIELRTVGYLGTQLPLRVDLADCDSAESAARVVSAALRPAMSEVVPGWDEVVDHARRSCRRVADSFEIKIAYQHVPTVLHDPVSGVTVRPRDPAWASSAFPLAVWIWDDGTSVRLEAHWRADACDGRWVRQLLDATAAEIAAAAGTDQNDVGKVTETMTDGFWDEDFAALPSAEEATTPRVDGEMLRQGGTTVPVVRGDGESAVEWLQANRDRWRALVAEHGTVLLRGFGVSSPEALAAATDHVFQTPYSTREHPRAVLGDRVVMPIEYPASLDLFWHNEDSFNHTWPALITFACRRPADEGGETTVVDGRAVLRDLDPEIRERFTREGVSYVRRFVPGLGLPWTTVFGTTDPDEVTERCAAEGTETRWVDGILETRSTRPAVLTDDQGQAVWFAQILHWHERVLEASVRAAIEEAGSVFPRAVTYGDGSPIEVDAVDAVVAASRKSDVAVPWEVGDLIVVDNRRMAHGRRAYRGERQIMVSLGDPQVTTVSTP